MNVELIEKAIDDFVSDLRSLVTFDFFGVDSLVFFKNGDVHVTYLFLQNRLGLSLFRATSEINEIFNQDPEKFCQVFGKKIIDHCSGRLGIAGLKCNVVIAPRDSTQSSAQTFFTVNVPDRTMIE